MCGSTYISIQTHQLTANPVNTLFKKLKFPVSLNTPHLDNSLCRFRDSGFRQRKVGHAPSQRYLKAVLESGSSPNPMLVSFPDSVSRSSSSKGEGERKKTVVSEAAKDTNQFLVHPFGTLGQKLEVGIGVDIQDIDDLGLQQCSNIHPFLVDLLNTRTIFV